MLKYQKCKILYNGSSFTIFHFNILINLTKRKCYEIISVHSNCNMQYNFHVPSFIHFMIQTTILSSHFYPDILYIFISYLACLQFRISQLHCQRVKFKCICIYVRKLNFKTKLYKLECHRDLDSRLDDQLDHPGLAMSLS